MICKYPKGSISRRLAHELVAALTQSYVADANCNTCANPDLNGKWPGTNRLKGRRRGKVGFGGSGVG